MTYTPALPSWDHQKKALELARNREYFAFLMEMGTGKTKVVIDEFCEYWTLGLVRLVVVIAPKGVYMNWANNELPTHVPKSIWGESVVRVWHSGGGNAAQRRALQDLFTDYPCLKILVVNTEAFSVNHKAENFVRDFLMQDYEHSYGVLDESTFIKTPGAARTKNIVSLADSMRWRRIMTGSPVTRGPLDLWSQAEFLKRGLLGQSYFAFRHKYAVLKDQRFGSRKVTMVVSYKNVDDLAERIRDWSYRVTKDECLDLPPKVYTRRDVEMTEEQARLYQELRDFALSEFAGGGTVSALSVITQVLRLQQLLCGHVKNDDGVLTEVPSRRVDALMEVLEEAPGKVIVWSKFRHDIQRIVETAEKKWPGSTAQFHGGNTQTRHLDVQRWQKTEDCRFLVASYAGGHGNTWIEADTVVYFSNDYDLEKRVQSEDRAHRGGQTKSVTYVDLVVPGTVDEKILRALRAKIDIAATITGDDYREWLL